jgi:hypothetical protein
MSKGSQEGEIQSHFFALLPPPHASVGYPSLAAIAATQRSAAACRSGSQQGVAWPSAVWTGRIRWGRMTLCAVVKQSERILHRRSTLERDVVKQPPYLDLVTGEGV